MIAEPTGNLPEPGRETRLRRRIRLALTRFVVWLGSGLIPPLDNGCMGHPELFIVARSFRQHEGRRLASGGPPHPALLEKGAPPVSRGARRRQRQAVVRASAPAMTLSRS